MGRSRFRRSQWPLDNLRLLNGDALKPRVSATDRKYPFDAKFSSQQLFLPFFVSMSLVVCFDSKLPGLFPSSKCKLFGTFAEICQFYYHACKFFSAKIAENLRVFRVTWL